MNLTEDLLPWGGATKANSFNRGEKKKRNDGIEKNGICKLLQGLKWGGMVSRLNECHKGGLPCWRRAWESLVGGNDQGTPRGWAVEGARGGPLNNPETLPVGLKPNSSCQRVVPAVRSGGGARARATPCPQIFEFGRALVPAVLGFQKKSNIH